MNTVSDRNALVLGFSDVRACLQSLNAELEIAVGAFIWSTPLAFKLQGLVDYIGDDGQSKGHRTADLGPGRSCQIEVTASCDRSQSSLRRFYRRARERFSLIGGDCFPARCAFLTR